MDQDQPLHPNLARLAAAYDNIFERFSNGLINAAQAQAEIGSLEARDDQGVQWSLDPRSGGWRRRTKTGDYVADTPPSYGLATPTAHDLTRNPDAFNPDSRITFHHVDEALLHPPSSLLGATRRPPVLVPETAGVLAALRRSRPAQLVLAAVTAAVTAGWWWTAHRTVPLQPVPVPAVSAPGQPTAPAGTRLHAPAPRPHAGGQPTHRP